MEEWRLMDAIRLLGRATNGDDYGREITPRAKRVMVSAAIGHLLKWHNNDLGDEEGFDAEESASKAV